MEQGKIDDEEEEKQLRRGVKEYSQTYKTPPPQYYAQEFKDDINQNNFVKFLGMDNDMDYLLILIIIIVLGNLK